MSSLNNKMLLLYTCICSYMRYVFNKVYLELNTELIKYVNEIYIESITTPIIGL